MLLLYPFPTALFLPNWRGLYFIKNVLVDNGFWMIAFVCLYFLFYTFYFDKDLIFLVTKPIQFWR
jgi:hypothetical protein